MSIPASYLDTLRDQVSIAETIGRRISFDPRKSVPGKGDYWACCPFHGEKTPSFHVDDRKGYYYCFGCHEKGSALDFVMKHDRLEFLEAVRVLAAEAGLPAPPEADPRARRKESARATLAEATEAAVAFFRERLESAEGAEARAYLERRGLTRETIERFELGYAPDARDAATRALSKAGFSPELLVGADIAAAPEGGGAPYDRFRHRVIFPIRDGRGRCIAFGGRALSPEAKAKYLNSRETELFKKGRSLYNYGPARAAAAHGPLLVVEGYMDVLMLAQHGFEAAVAPLGTALTEAQLELLWRVVDEPVLALDGDAAGQRAASRAADLATPHLKPGKSLCFATLPPGQDPDDLARAGGAAAVRALIDGAEPLIDLLWRREALTAPVDTPERRAALEARLTALIERIQDPTVRRHYEYAFKDRRFHLFRPQRGGGGGAKSGPRRPGPGGPGRWAPPPPGPTAEARAKALAAAAQSADMGVLREGAMVLLLIEDPRLLETRGEMVEALDFVDQALDSVKNALLSGVAELDELERETPGGLDPAARLTALMGFVDHRCGEGALAGLRVRLKERLGGPFAGDERSYEASCRLFDELAAMHRAKLAWRREIEAYKAELLEDGAEDAAPHRLQEAQKEIVRSQGGAEESQASETELSQKLQSFVDAQPWIKRSKRRVGGP